MLILFPDERVLSSSDGNKVVLTTHRISYESQRWGASSSQSIMLEHITSCEHHRINRYEFLIIAGLLAVGSAILAIKNMPLEILGFLGGAALLFAAVFWLTQYSLIVIGSPSAKISINVTGMNKENILSFINKIEQAKHKRYLAINGRS